MARGIAFYKQLLIKTKNETPELAGLTSDSKVSNWGNFAFISAFCASVIEQLVDAFRVETEKIVQSNSASTNAYISYKSKNFFQYDAVVNQVLTVDFANEIVTYPVIDASKRIITRCSVTTMPDKEIRIQVAKNEPPEPCDSAELIAYRIFLDHYLPAGVSYTAASSASDKVLVQADVYFDGNVTTSIKQDVEFSINEYLKNIDETGYLIVSELQNAINDTKGVVSVVLKKVYLRPNINALSSALKVYDLDLGININKERFTSGYAVSETTLGSTLTDTITYISA